MSCVQALCVCTCQLVIHYVAVCLLVATLQRATSSAVDMPSAEDPEGLKLRDEPPAAELEKALTAQQKKVSGLEVSHLNTGANRTAAVSQRAASSGE